MNKVVKHFPIFFVGYCVYISYVSLLECDVKAQISTSGVIVVPFWLGDNNNKQESVRTCINLSAALQVMWFLCGVPLVTQL